MIRNGQVSVNGEIVTDLPVWVDPSRDRILIDGRAIPKPTRHAYVMFHKPERCLATLRDEEGLDRRTVSDLVQHPAGVRLFPVGRLDFQTSGLLLLTSDGQLAHRLTHARFATPKTYLATVKGEPDPMVLQRLEREIARGRRRSAAARGVAPENGPSVTVERAQGARTLLRITLRETPDRPLGDLLAMVGLLPRRLERVAIGPVQLSGLPIGTWRELTREEVTMLKRSGSEQPTELRRRITRPSKRGGRAPGTGGSGGHAAGGARTGAQPSARGAKQGPGPRRSSGPPSRGSATKRNAGPAPGGARRRPR